MSDRHRAELDIDDFVYESIKDIQATIRAIDFKISVLLIILALPLGKVDDIYTHFQKSYSDINFVCDEPILFIVLSLTILAWATAFFGCLRALSGISNPSKHVDSADAGGLFYQPGLFKFSTFSFLMVIPSKKALR